MSSGVPHGRDLDGLLRPWADLLLTAESRPITAPSSDRPGIYAIDYRRKGDPLYALIPARWPTYIGSTVALATRLSAHRKTLSIAGIDLGTVSVRVLPTDTPWIRLIEEYLIDYYQPLWNVILTGFGGKKDDSKTPLHQRLWWQAMRDIIPSTRFIEEYHVRLSALPHFPSQPTLFDGA